MHQASCAGALDSVANFHLGNGAEVAGLSWAVSRGNRLIVLIRGRATIVNLPTDTTCSME
jgi:hypothetical protein